MKKADIRKFLVFFILYFITVMIIQVYIYPSEDAMESIILKNIVSGLIAAVIFAYLTRKKGKN
jgi:branched-subunit amino acid transport protein